MWWVLIPALAVLLSIVLALAFRGVHSAPVRFDRSINEPERD